MDGGSKMILSDETIKSIIINKIDTYDKMLSDIMNSDNPDEKLAGKYRYYIMCLDELSKEFFFNDHAVFETLRQNFGKHDTELIFLDDSSYTIKKDDICSFKDNCVLIYDKEKFEKYVNKVPAIEKVLNVGNVKLIKTLS